MANEAQIGATVQEGADYIRSRHLPALSTGKPQHPPATTTEFGNVLLTGDLQPSQLPVRIEDPKCVARRFPDWLQAFLGTAVPARSAHSSDLY